MFSVDGTVCSVHKRETIAGVSLRVKDKKRANPALHKIARLRYELKLQFGEPFVGRGNYKKSLTLLLSATEA